MSVKGNSPLLGYNTNVRHKGVLCHVQTEDSGAAHPHITTHVFTDGVIVATKRRSYAEHVGEDNLELIVRKMMQEQHKQMCIALRDGEFDAAASLGDTQKIVLDRPLEEVIAQEQAAECAPAAPPAVQNTTSSDPPLPDAVDATEQQRRTEPAPFHISDNFDSPPPPSATQAKPPLPAQSTYHATPFEVVRTPAPMLRPTGPSLTPRPATPIRTPQPPIRTPAPSARRTLTPSPQGQGPGRYSSPRPALFRGAQTPPPPQEPPPFGGEHISDKSLDEVILAYLAEEVDEKG